MRRAAIRAIATARPAFRMPREEWLAIADRISPPEVDRRVLARLAERSGIDTRWCAAFERENDCFYQAGSVPGTAERMALWSRAARAMALEASAAAIARARDQPEAITHLVTASCTGFESPGVDAHLIASLGLSPEVKRLHVGFMGCHAAVNALGVAHQAVLADPRARVLVCCAEVCSAHFHHTARLDQLIANTLFADGAAALVVAAAREHEPEPGIASTHSIVIPNTAAEMRWTIGDHGFEMTLGAQVPDRLEREVGGWVRRVLAGQGLEVDDIGGWAIHPGGPRVIESVLASLALDPRAGDASRAVLRECGNMSSATLPFILERLRADQDRTQSQRPMVGLAFGPGLVGEMVVIRPPRAGENR